MCTGTVPSLPPFLSAMCMPVCCCRMCVCSIHSPFPCAVFFAGVCVCSEHDRSVFSPCPCVVHVLLLVCCAEREEVEVETPATIAASRRYAKKKSKKGSNVETPLPGVDKYHSTMMEDMFAGDRCDSYFSLQALKAGLPGVIVQGIATVNRAVITQEDKLGPDGKPTFKLLVEGTGLKEVMGTAGVKARSTQSNNVVETMTHLGIEAARTTIQTELLKTYRSYGECKRGIRRVLFVC